MHIVQMKNQRSGITYVYESQGYWDTEKQQARSRRKCIGKLDPETGALIPSRKHQIEQELTALKKRTPGPVPAKGYTRLFWGATYLFDALGERLGVTADLQRSFPDHWRQILSVAYYLILEDRNPLSRFPRWARTHVHPYGQELSSQRSSELFAALGEDAKHRFCQAQARRRLEQEYLAYDTTSISSYSKLIRQVKYGHNKDHEPLPQINLALLYGHHSRLPVAYRKLPGNITDVMTLRKLLKDMNGLELKKVKLVMDRGFYSAANVNALYQHHVKFVMGVKTSLKLVQQELEVVRERMRSRQHYSSNHRLNAITVPIKWPYRETTKRSGRVVSAEKRMYLHLYHNAQRAADDQAALNTLLDTLEEELRSGKPNPEHEPLYRKYYSVHQTPQRGMKLTPKQEAIDEAQKNYGTFALISNEIKDPLQVLNIYRTNDVIEKAFGNLKERLNLRRTSVSSEENLAGKLFVQFVALIYLASIDKAMSDTALYQTHTLQGLLDELDIIERYEQPGRRPHVGEMTKKQQEIYQKLGVEPPS